MSQWGAFRLIWWGGTFWGASNMTVTATDPLSLENITDLQAIFAGCESLTTLPSLADWDVSIIARMNSMFSGATLFNEDISAWDTGAVTTMDHMFRGCSAFNQDIGAWDVSGVTDMDDMFHGADLFNRDIGAWNVSNVTTMNGNV